MKKDGIVGAVILIFCILMVGCNHSKRKYYKYYSNGKVRLEYVPTNDIHKDTIVYLYYQDGNLCKKHMLRNGHIQDTAYFYFENGRLSQESYFDSGKSNGICYNFFENGAIEAIGRYKNGLETGEWTFFDSLRPGKVLSIKQYIIINGRSTINKYLEFNDSLGHIHLEGRYYTVLPKITGIVKGDTMYSFIINIVSFYKGIGKIRIIYGDLGDDFSNCSKADTLYPRDGVFMISNININKTPKMKGILEVFKKEYNEKRKDTLTRVLDSYFFLNPRNLD